MANIDRARMEKTIKEGGTVLHEGRMIGRVQDLPPAEELAKGNVKALEAEHRSVQDQIRKLQEQDGKLAAAIDEAKAAPPPVKTADAPKPAATEPAAEPQAASTDPEPPPPATQHGVAQKHSRR